MRNELKEIIEACREAQEMKKAGMSECQAIKYMKDSLTE